MEIAITDDVSKSNEPSSWTDPDEINLTSFSSNEFSSNNRCLSEFGT